MRAFRLIPLLLSLTLSSFALAQSTVDPTKVVARVNGAVITAGEVALAVEDLTAQYPSLPAERQRQVALEFLVEVKLAAQAALGAKLDASDDFARKLLYAKERILMERLLQNEGQKATSEPALKRYYDEQIAQLKPVEEVRARHILVESEDEAKKIAARLKAGEDFARLAAELSKDPGSGKEGGDLGYFTKERMVPEFAEAAFLLAKGEVSAPVKSDFGWHVIKQEDKRPRAAPPFEQVKERLSSALANKAQTDFIAKLREGAKIEVLELGLSEPKKN
jgi:peptidyl-prolyl cis-trans isomerase C